MSPWILVDDSDSGISYNGPGWFQDKGSLDSLGNGGPPYLSTLHGTQSDGNFSYSFTGTRVVITGTNQVFSSSGVTNPSFQCLVDGESVPVETLTDPVNRLLFCRKDGLSVGQHEISVRVTVSNQQTFWFDYIQYLPTSSVSLANAALVIDFTDSQIQYGSGWLSNDLGSSTSQNGATLSFQFTGISLTWLGYYDNNQALLSTTATYSIDGQTPTSFSLMGGATNRLLNQIMFQTPQLSAGSHKLDIVYQGNSQSTPLTLNTLIFQNGDSNPTSSGTQIASTTGATTLPSGFSFTTDSTGGVFATRVVSTGSGSVNNSSNLGPIIGGVVGGLTLLLLAVFGCLFFRRRTRRMGDTLVQPMEDTFALSMIEPFTQFPTTTISTSVSGKPPSSVGTSNFFEQQQRTGQVGDEYGSLANPYPGSVSSLGYSGQGSSSGGNQYSASHSRGISSSVEHNSSAEGPVVQMSSNLQAPEIVRPQQKLRLQSPLPLAASNDTPSMQPTRVIHEEDSGIRLPHSEIRVEVLPPRYTAG